MIKFSNNLRTLLAANASSTDTQIQVTSTANFPALGANDILYLTLTDAFNAAPEVVKCTAVNGTTLTVVRGQEGTTPATWNAATGVSVTGRLTAELLETVTKVDVPEYIAAITKDMTGFPNRTDQVLTINESTRTVTIAPTAASFDVWYRGRKITISSPLSLVLTNQTGVRYIKYNPSTQQLAETTINGYPDITSDLLVAMVFWEVVNQKAIIFADERHSSQRDTQWHLSQHLDVGAIWRSGGAINYSLHNNNAKISLQDIVIADEDILFNISHGPASVPYQQILQGSAEIPSIYLIGTNTVTESTPTTSPWLKGTSRVYYNPIANGVGSIVECTNNKYVSYYLVATNDSRYPIKALMGHYEHTTVADAEAEEFNNFGFDVPELVPLYKVILNTVTNVYGCQIEAVYQLSTRQTKTTGAFSTTSHSALTERSISDQHPIDAITGLQEALNSKLPTTGKAADTTLWDGKQFVDYVDQPVRTTDTVSFSSISVGDVQNALSTVTDISAWVYNDSFSNFGQDTEARGLVIDPTGTKLYIIGNSSNSVHQYILTTPWTISSAFYTAKSLVTTTQEGTPLDLAFSSDGTKIFVIGGANTVFVYGLTTPWDVSTATYSNISFLASAQDTSCNALAFDADGTKMYIGGTTNDKVYEYALSTAWDVTTAVYTNNSLSLAAIETTVQGIAFNSTGTKLYVTGSDYARVTEYILSTAWALTSAVYSGATSIGLLSMYSVQTPSGIFVNLEQNKVWITDYTNDRIFELSTNKPATCLSADKIVLNTDTEAYYNFTVNKNLRVNGNIFAPLSAATLGSLTTTSSLTAGSSVTMGTTTGTISIGTSQTTGATTIGGTAQTGAIQIGRSTAAQTVNIATGANTTGVAKTVNIATGGATGSTTTMTIGSANGTTVSANGTWNFGGAVTIGGSTTITGNLVVNGTTTTVNSTTVTLDDPIVTLGGDVAPTVDDNKDRGIEFRWHNGTAAKLGFFGFDDSTGKLTFIPDSTNTSEVFSGTTGELDAKLGWANVINSPFTQASLTTSTTAANQVVDMFDKATIRTAKYLVQATSGTAYHSLEAIVIHDGTTVTLVVYAEIMTGARLITLDADISSTNARLLVTPVNAVTVVKVIRTAIQV